jgi:hypothetical protein
MLYEAMQKDVRRVREKKGKVEMKRPKATKERDRPGI